MIAGRSSAEVAAVRWLPSVLVGVIAFAAARVTLLPGLGFWDTGELQAVAPLMGTAHPTGFPTYVLLGWLANLVLTPFGEPALRMNLFAALSLAVAAAVTADLARALTRSAALGILAGLGLALTDIAWAIGTHADAHALHLALVAILFRGLVAWEDRVTAAGAADADTGTVTASWSHRPSSSGWPSATTRWPCCWRRASRSSSWPWIPGSCAGRACSPPVPGPGGDHDPGLPRAAAARRAVPCADGLRPPGYVGRLLVHRAGRAVPRERHRPPHGPSLEGRRGRASGGRGLRSAGGPDPGRLRRDGLPAAHLRAPERHLGAAHARVRDVVRQRGDRSLLPRAGPHRLDLAGDPRGAIVMARVGRGPRAGRFRRRRRRRSARDAPREPARTRSSPWGLRPRSCCRQPSPCRTASPGSTGVPTSRLAHGSIKRSRPCSPTR